MFKVEHGYGIITEGAVNGVVAREDCCEDELNMRVLAWIGAGIGVCCGVCFIK